jgi:adenylylsulfate kinase
MLGGCGELFVLALASTAFTGIIDTMSGGNEAIILWLYGLPSAGKSTLAEAVASQWRRDGRPFVLLDGDEVRRGLCRDLGFSVEDRTENIRRVAEAARLIADSGVSVIAALITPLDSQRRMLAEVVGLHRLQRVWVHCPLAECIRRDAKGLYALAVAGGLAQLTGRDSPFEEPSGCERCVDTGTLDREAAIRALIEICRNATTLADGGRQDDSLIEPHETPCQM